MGPVFACACHWRRFHVRGAAGLKPFKQRRQVHPERTRDPRQVIEADVLLAAFNLSDVRSVKSTDVGKFLLRPLPACPKLAHPIAEMYQ